jgi:hypothetical protein
MMATGCLASTAISSPSGNATPAAFYVAVEYRPSPLQQRDHTSRVDRIILTRNRHLSSHRATPMPRAWARQCTCRGPGRSTAPNRWPESRRSWRWTPGWVVTRWQFNQLCLVVYQSRCRVLHSDVMCSAHTGHPLDQERRSIPRQIRPLGLP